MNLEELCIDLCDAERDRAAAAEICIDELLTIMDRHAFPEAAPMYMALRAMSQELHRASTEADGPLERRKRLIRIRNTLTTAMPLTDDDLGVRRVCPWCKVVHDGMCSRMISGGQSD